MNRPQNTESHNRNSSNLRPEGGGVSARAREMRQMKRRELVRHGYAAGGDIADDGPTLDFGGLGEAIGGIGNALGTGLGGLGDGLSSILAQAAESAAPSSRERIVSSDAQQAHRRNALSDALMQAGFAMMASPHSNPLQAIGEGGMRGLAVYRDAQAANEKYDQDARQRRADADFAKRILSGAAGVTAPESEIVVPSTSPTEMRGVPVPTTGAGGAGPTPGGSGPLAPESSAPKSTKKPDGVVPDEGKQRPASRDLDDRLAYLQREYNRASTMAALAESPAQRQAATARLNALRFEIGNTRAERDRAERNNKSDIGVIGQDDFGQPVYGYRSGPKAGQPLKADQPADAAVPGDAILERMPPQYQNYIQGIARGEIEPPKGPRGQKIIEIVSRIYPGFNTDTFAQRRSMRRGYAPEGKIGQQMSSASAALQHSEALLDAHNRMGNSNWHAVNAVVNPLSRLKENPALNDFETNKLALIGEVEKYLKGGSPAESSLREMAKQISPNSTPAEIRAVLYKIAEVMNGKTKGYVSDWDRVFGNTGAELPANTLPHSMDENLRIEDLLRKEFVKTQKPAKPSPAEPTRQGVTVARPNDGDEIESHGAKYRWSSQAGKFLRVKEGGSND